MKHKTKTLFISLFLLLGLAFTANSQIGISNVAEIPKIKKGTTYIVMKNPDSEKSKEFKDVFQKYWTFSKIEFIKFADIGKYLSEENSFLDIRAYTSTGSYQTTNEKYVNPGLKGDRSYSNTYFYLELWNCNEKWLKSKKKNLVDLDAYKRYIVKIELGTDQESMEKPDNLNQSDFDGKDHLQNWGPGILKNYIQLIELSLEKGEEDEYEDDIYNYEELKKLKDETLYIPSYVLLKYMYNAKDTRNIRDVEDVIGDYKFKYKILTKDELNDKILNEKEPFYYLLYTQDGGHKYVSVVNAQTGELIFSISQVGYYKFKSGDMKDIQKAVLKK